MKSSKPIVFALLLSLATSHAMAVPVTESISYNGTYLPNDGAPPAGQTTFTWDQAAIAGVSITPNSPAPGLATLLDGGDGRITFFKTYTDPAFSAAPADFEWEYSTRHQINSAAGPANTAGIFIGARDEGGNGKTVMLGFNSNQGTLGFHNNTNGLTQALNGSDFRDGRFHDYRVIKFIDPADSLMKVSVLIDGVPEGSPILYSNNTAFPLDANANQGFGYFSPSTGHTSNVVMDQLRFGAPGALPTFVASYNGTYAPDSAAPPLTQTTWTVFNNIGAANLTPNAIAGIARINDSTGGRIGINDLLTDTPLADEGWRFQTRLRIDTAAQSSNGGGALPYIAIGVRDEGVEGGKSALLGFFNSELRLVDNSTNLNANSILVASVDLRGGTLFHDLVVEKFLVDDEYFIQVYLNDVAQFADPLAYSLLPDSVGTANGFGYFSSSPATSNVLLDTLALQLVAPPIIPEPATALLAMLGLPLMMRRRQRA